MKSEFQNQLEALGFKRTQEIPKPSPKKKIKAKAKKKVKPTSLPLKSDKEKRFRQRKVVDTPQLSKVEAKAILEALHSDNKNWETPKFSKAYRCLTGRKTILTYEQSQGIVRLWHKRESRVYELDYSIAVFIISGIWISPLPKQKQGMSKQVKARCERRDINGSYDVWVYKN
ncbi:hypothetical protein BCU13_015555 [Vibrio lentus]|uniref:hypothetical protein n=1 Tax=Vibrio lentus TaxID=136468 RepID=UPI000C81804F|nr:hypothetical protein [Vibrio lentus]PMJ80735.1 hypothetical protein BCU13_22490 [Vibrio lentus]